MRVLIVGGGISGAATAFYLREFAPGVEIEVLERAEVSGGAVRSEVSEEGYTVNWGPNGFLSNVPETLDLVKALGLEASLLTASDLAKHRYLFREETLKPIPTHPLTFLKSDLLSPLGKLRILLEPLVSRLENGSTVADVETVYEFAARRLGPEFATAFMSPMILGITSGDAKQTSLSALFPRMRKMELEYGSLFKAVFAKKRDKTSTPTRLTSFVKGGMQVLTDALDETLGPLIKTNVNVTSVHQADDGRWEVETEGGGEIAPADVLVLATPAYVSSKLLSKQSRGLSKTLLEIPYASVRVVALGYPETAVPRKLDGFGFLAPRGQGLRSLGVLWTSSLYSDYAPPGHVLLRVIAGGVHDSSFADLDDAQALWEVRRDLSRMMGIVAPPDFVRQIPWRRTIPQYQPDHLKRLAEIDDHLRVFDGRLQLTGNAYRGVGVNDCVRDAKRTAVQISATLA